jgi:hypothetical protein
MVQSRHYPYAHRKYGLIYPWSLTEPTFTHFEFDRYKIGLGNDADADVRIGEDMFTNLADMLTSTMTAAERQVPERPLNAGIFLGVATITGRYPLKAASLPAGITQINPGTADNLLRLRCSFYHRYGTVGSPIDPTTRPERRVHLHRYYIFIETTVRAVLTNGTSTASVTASGRWGTNTPGLSDLTTIGAVPTIARLSDSASVNATATRSTLQGYFAVIGGFPPNTAYDAAVALEATTQTELAALTMTAVYKLGAVLAAVKSSVVNSTGTNSLESWSPLLF